MYQEREIFDLAAILPLLAKCGLKENGETDYTLGLYDGRTLVATGSIHDHIIQMVAVDPDYQGEGLSAQVVSGLLSRANYEGWLPLYLFTKPSSSATFQSMGFHLVAMAEPYAALLEFGHPDVEAFCNSLQAYRKPGAGTALVMNCNPFTLGHQYLVESAAAAAGDGPVYLFMVEEDRSVFPFQDRLELVKRGTAHLPNVTVIPGGPYVISSLTFPSYFTRDEALAHAHAKLDAVIFRDRIAPALEIRRRYVGTEPLSPVTAIYNETLKEVFAGSVISLTEVERKTQGDAPVSASRVRELLASGRIAEVEKLVPESTMAYLESGAGKLVTERLRQT